MATFERKYSSGMNIKSTPWTRNEVEGDEEERAHQLLEDEEARKENANRRPLTEKMAADTAQFLRT